MNPKVVNACSVAGADRSWWDWAKPTLPTHIPCPPTSLTACLSTCDHSVQKLQILGISTTCHPLSTVMYHTVVAHECAFMRRVSLSSVRPDAPRLIACGARVFMPSVVLFSETSSRRSSNRIHGVKSNTFSRCDHHCQKHSRSHERGKGEPSPK